MGALYQRMAADLKIIGYSPGESGRVQAGGKGCRGFGPARLLPRFSTGVYTARFFRAKFLRVPDQDSLREKC
jgi:hypothetical protein